MQIGAEAFRRPICKFLFTILEVLLKMEREWGIILYGRWCVMKLITRNQYLEKLINVIGTPDIKVIMGVRHSGKSKLLETWGRCGRTFATCPAKKCSRRQPSITRKKCCFRRIYTAPDLTAIDVTRYNGRLYNITRIDTFEGYKQDLTLYCSRRAR